MKNKKDTFTHFSSGTIFAKGKKCISPVVATALLLVVAVVAVVGFQGWFQSYSSNMFSDVEIQSANYNDIGIETIIGNTLYVKSRSNLNVTIRFLSEIPAQNLL